jgi:aryl-alcohol dehydrogenase-like predicted oxidoreductase
MPPTVKDTAPTMGSTTRRLGRSEIKVSALGLGCWPIGGPWTMDGRPVGRGRVDIDEAARAIRTALDLGVTFFDTAGSYGAGQSERILGRALAGHRRQVVIATKFGVRVNEADQSASRITEAVLENVHQDCEDSLRRLGTDWIDLFQLHVGDYPVDRVPSLVQTLEELVKAGKIRAYGWSTDDVHRPQALTVGEHCTAVLHELNVLTDAPDMLALCEALDQASIDKYPFLMGVLAGRFDKASTFPDQDIRHRSIPPDSDKRKRWFAQLGAVREILIEDGRTLAQGALAWIWARSDRTLPIPGFRTSAQVAENAGAIALGPLTADQMLRIDLALHREPVLGGRIGS